jgi:fatty-acid desaturase
MKIYNAVGYLIILAYMLACIYAAPASMGHGTALLIGGTHFFFCWFFAGLYLADLLHLGIAHRSLDYKDWFMKAVTVVNNVFGLYVEPVSWVNRHRLHHKNADHDGDPNKLSDDGFWRTAYLCVMPYRCQEDLASDAEILKSRTFRVVGNPLFAIVVQALSFYLLWKIAGSLKFALVMWFGMRIFAWWVNMIQNYWTHVRKFGYRRYDDDDNAMNIGEWFPVTATFSACLQNNHHHYPTMLRLSHDESEYDFGFLTVKVMKRLGLVKATGRGEIVPHDVPLAALDF